MSDIDRRVRGGLLTIAVAASCACSLFGPTESIEGLWVGHTGASVSFPDRAVYLSLHQNDDRITGLACLAISGSFGVPVRGTYPHVKFEGWEGTLEKSGAIVSTKISDFEKFTRTDTLSPRCSCLFTPPTQAGCYF